MTAKYHKEGQPPSSNHERRDHKEQGHRPEREREREIWEV